MRKRLGALVVAVAMLAVGCGSEEGGSGGEDPSEPFRIVTLAGISQPGAAALNAQAAVQAAKAAAAVLNDNGGVLGHEVEVEVIDDQGKSTLAVSKLQERLRSGETPNLVMPGNTSAEALPAAPLITEEEILMVTQASTTKLNNPEEYPYTFNTPPVPASWAQALVEQVKADGGSRIAMIYGDDAFGESTAAATRTAVEEAGLTLTGEESYSAEDLDMTSQLQRLRATKPDVLYLQGMGAPVGYILDGRAKLGWTDTPVIGDATTATNQVVTTEPPEGILGTPAAENLTVQALAGAVSGADTDPEKEQATADMLAALKEQGDIKLPLNVYFAYDCVMLAAAAAEEAGTISDAAAMAEALEGFEADTKGRWALSSYDYSPKSHSPEVNPDDVATIPPTTLTDGQYQAPAAG